MKLNKRGFIATSLIYSFFLIFLMMLVGILTNYVHHRIIVSGLKRNVTSDLADKIEKTKSAIRNTNDLKIGDYVAMTPSGATFTPSSSQTGYTNPGGYYPQESINPKELNVWRVIRKNDDGTVDLISEYTTSKPIYFEGEKGMQNYVGYLNNVASRYENNKYTVGSRAFGYVDQTEFITNPLTYNNAGFDSPETEELNYKSFYESQGGGDSMFQEDVELVLEVYDSLLARNGKNSNFVDYWVASRYYYGVGDEWGSFAMWYPYIVDEYGGEVTRRYSFYSESNYSNEPEYTSWDVGSYFRPIITLKADLEIEDGDGESDETAYELAEVDDNSLVTYLKEKGNMTTLTHENTTLTGGYANDEYRFIGNNPNNYVNFNNELWRVIGVFNIDNGNGRYEERVKLIRATATGNEYWNNYQNNEWSSSSLRSNLNNSYLYRSGSYSSVGLNQDARNLIDNATWYSNGLDYFAASSAGSSAAEFIYKNEREANPTVSQVGIMNISDYVYATSGGSTCYSSNSIFQDNSTCYSKNWIYFSNVVSTDTTINTSSGGYSTWTINKTPLNTASVFWVSTKVSMAYWVNDTMRAVRPCVYLKSSVQKSGGTGTKSDPYRLSEN